LESFGFKTKFLNELRRIFMLAPLEKLLANQTQGKLPDSMLGRLVPNNYQYKPGSIRVAERNGITFRFDLNDMVDWFNYFGFKELERDKLFTLLKPDDVLIDVGANMGEFSLKVAQLLGKGGKVVSFEPDLVNYQRLQTNFSLNPELAARITLHNFGLGEFPGTVNLSIVNESNRGMNRVVKDAVNFNSITINTLDNIVLSEQMTKVDWIKIDVEGFEMNVLKGARLTIQQFKPSLFIELDDKNLREQNSSASELVSWLNESGYTLTIARSGEELKSTTDFSNCHYDVLAIPSH
jgi:FkbM family methyltransferase